MVTDAAIGGDATASSSTPVQDARPYPPSWIDRLIARVERLRLPPVVTYLTAALVVLVLFAFNDWIDGKGFLLGLDPFHMMLGLELIYTVALVHFLDRQSEAAFMRLKPLLKCDEAGYHALGYRLTTIPARPALLASLAGLVVGLIAIAVERLALPSEFRVFILPGKGRYLLEVWLVATWFTFGALFYHTLHQLRLIDEIYTRHTHIDLDHFQPLFGFSRVSGLTAIGVLLIPYAWYITVPNLILDPVGILFGGLFPAFALVAFLWPLLGIHHQMVDAKAHALLENAKLLKDVRRMLHERVAARDLAGANEVRGALGAVREDRQALDQTPTWPWQPGTPRGVAAALLLPIMVWLLQTILGRFLR